MRPSVARALLVAVLFPASCGRSKAEPAPPASGSASARPAPSASAPAVVGASAEARACGARIEAAKVSPAAPGAPGFEARRAELLGRVRGAPLVWLEPPPPGALSGSWDPKAKKSALRLVRDLVRKHRKDPPAMRAALLRDGWVYEEDPDLALALVETARLVELFREPEIHLLRGGAVRKLRRAPRDKLAPERYVHADGEDAGAAAELLLGDRVAVEAKALEGPAVGVDVTPALREVGADRLEVKRLGRASLTVELRLGPGAGGVPALLEISGAAAKLACVAWPEGREAALRGTSAARKRVDAALERVRVAATAAVREELRFDEPKGEPEGEQQDGALRREWRLAYTEGRRRYEVNGRTYEVYDGAGRPIPPEVCIDFVTDTWERASGTWYAPLGADKRPAPARTKGSIDLDEVGLVHRRSVASFVRWASKDPGRFEVWDLPEDARIPLLRRRELFAWLSAHADDVRPLDVLAIHGMGGHGRPTWHSVIVLAADPVTGVPTLVAGNAVKPRLQTLEGVMQRSPKRSIKHRVRPKPEWLVAALGG